MNCTVCNTKSCRSLDACKAGKFNSEDIQYEYHEPKNQRIVQAAATLVDNGRSGTLGRLQELTEFAAAMNYKKIGLAYCWGMEAKAAQVVQYLKSCGLPVSAVSCTVGGLGQDAVNQASCTHKVACNPLAQAEQMNSEGVDFAVTMGLCMGHDIIFNKKIKADVTTLLVKDRVYNHQPLQYLEKLTV